MRTEQLVATTDELAPRDLESPQRVSDEELLLEYRATGERQFFETLVRGISASYTTISADIWAIRRWRRMFSRGRSAGPPQVPAIRGGTAVPTLALCHRDQCGH